MAQTLYGDAVPVILNGSDATAYAMGTRFTPAVAGTATHGRRYFPTTLPASPVSIAIYRNSDQSLRGSATFPGDTPAGWQQVAFSVPIELEAGIEYSVVFWTPAPYTATSQYFASARTNGADLSMPASAGRFGAASGMAFPSSVSGNAAYFADLVFEPGGTAPVNAIPTGIAVSVGLGPPAAQLALTAAPTGLPVSATLGAPTGSLGLLGAPAGLPLAVAPGSPAAQLALTAAPAGAAVPITLGSPSAGGGSTPAGLAIPVALGAPAAQLARSSTPAGLAIRLLLGTPSATDAPPAASSPSRPLVTVTGPRRITTVSRTHLRKS